MCLVVAAPDDDDGSASDPQTNSDEEFGVRQGHSLEPPDENGQYEWASSAVSFDLDARVWKTKHKFPVADIPLQQSRECRLAAWERVSQGYVAREADGCPKLNRDGFLVGTKACIPIQTECPACEKPLSANVPDGTFIVRTTVGSVARARYKRVCKRPTGLCLNSTKIRTKSTHITIPSGCGEIVRWQPESEFIHPVVSGQDGGESDFS